MNDSLKSKRRTRYQYAAKFICTSTIPGTSQQSSFPPGTYQTSINVHNPLEKGVAFRVKLAHPIDISKWLTFKLKGDGVISFDCRTMEKFELKLIHGFEGFLVIESSTSLDVIGVYTAAGEKYVVSIDVERVKERKIK
jgi:hypothetical protein